MVLLARTATRSLKYLFSRTFIASDPAGRLLVTVFVGPVGMSNSAAVPSILINRGCADE
jgi:hypothetical protein